MFTEFDVFIIIILMISSIVGFLRGLVKELLSVLSWIGAAFITFSLFPYLAEEMDKLFKNSIVINVVSIIVVFLAVLAFISLVNAMLLDNLREFRSGIIDRSFGTLFGLMRGVVIISILHFMVVLMHNDKEGKGPEWLQEGETYRLTRFGGDILRDSALDYVEKLQVDDEEDEDPLMEGFDEKLEEFEEGVEKSLKERERPSSNPRIPGLFDKKKEK